MVLKNRHPDQDAPEGVVVVIPAHNEAEVIGGVVDEVHSAGPYRVVVVDDGSRDETSSRARARGAYVLRHRINRGKGAAVKTGIMAARWLNPAVLVTMDGDGQHDPQDIESLIRPIVLDHCDVVLGSRLLDPRGMPWHKRLANRFGNLMTLLFYGMLVTDSQSGFRAYSGFAARIIDTKADKYEYDSKVIREIRSNRLRCTEVPVRVRYTDYSMNKPQRQSIWNGVKTLWRMLWQALV
jgi:glycosyltransferase involved in cell wall biosynthesis